MRRSHPHGKVPPDSQLAAVLEAAATSLADDLRSLDPMDLNISEYNQRYLRDKLQNVDAELRLATYTIAGALSHCQKRLQDMVFIEYGGGVGLFSLVAKKAGVGTVIYNDIYDVSCDDAAEIARVLACQAEHYVPGDLDDLVAFCKSKELKCDGMGSYDVLEHIYDIDAFCRDLHLLCHAGTTMLHSSGANMFFYPYVKSVSEKQIAVETTPGEEQWGRKKRDSLSAYAKVREEIIRECGAEYLTEYEIRQLVAATRGLMRDDILSCVKQYRESKELPREIEHPTNTCDPQTGNWCERLMNPWYLQEALSSHGFDARVLPGYWAPPGRSSTKPIASLLNLVIRTTDTHTALHLAPYYSIFARYHGAFREERHRKHMYRYRYSPLWYAILALWGPFSRLYHR